MSRLPTETPDDASTDEMLMSAYANGDAAAFARLYDRHERPVHRYFLRHGVGGAQADDLLQETWMSIVRNAATYTVAARFTTWLYTIARSKLVDHWRAAGRHAMFEDAANDETDRADDDAASAIESLVGDDTVRPDVRAMSRQRAEAFIAAVEALPAPQREAFLLHVDGELSLVEMAAIAQVGAETLKTRLRYAMKKLRLACADWLVEPTSPVHRRCEVRDEA